MRDLLRHFFKDDRRSFTCEQCNDKTEDNAIYKSRLVKIPQVLVLHLKRFTYDLKNGTLEKNRRSLQVPPVIEVTEWDDAPGAPTSSDINHPESAPVCCPCASAYDAEINLEKGPRGAIDMASAAIAMEASNEDASKDESSASSMPATYVLSGVVRHLGVDCRSGHYVADVPLPDSSSSSATPAAEGVSLSDKWKRCDDSSVREISLKTVLGDRDSPYLLFYRLVNKRRGTERA